MAEERPRPKHPDPVLVYETRSYLSDYTRRRLAQTWLTIVAAAFVGAIGYGIWTDPLPMLAVLGLVAGVVGLMLGVPWAVIELTERQPERSDGTPDA